MPRPAPSPARRRKTPAARGAKPSAARLWVVAVVNGLYGLLLLAPTVWNSAGPEHTWPGCLNLYLPQWLWAVPGVLPLLLTALLAWRWTWVPLLALLWVAGPLMGFCGPNGAPPAASGPTLRVMTYNIKWGHHDVHAIAQDIRAFHPDVLQCQDATGIMDGGEIAQLLSGWNVRVDGQYVVASRLPLPPLQSRRLDFEGREHHCDRYTLQVGGKTVVCYDVHLLTPRDGLLAVRHRQTEELVQNAEDRLIQASRLADDVHQESAPVIVTGDLNAPVQSLVCRRLFGAGLRDAFSDAGFGYGYTYGAFTRVGRSYVRIDHILTSRQWQVRRCWVGNERGSEHCPVIADLTLTDTP